MIEFENLKDKYRENTMENKYTNKEGVDTLKKTRQRKDPPPQRK